MTAPDPLASARQARREGRPLTRAEKDAAADYTREWRARNPEAYERAKSTMRARGRALTRLASLYPEDMAALLHEEEAR